MAPGITSNTTTAAVYTAVNSVDVESSILRTYNMEFLFREKTSSAESANSYKAWM